MIDERKNVRYAHPHLLQALLFYVSHQTRKKHKLNCLQNMKYSLSLMIICALLKYYSLNLMIICALFHMIIFSLRGSIFPTHFYRLTSSDGCMFVWMDGWTNYDFTSFLFNTISVILGRWAGYNERVCAMEPRVYFVGNAFFFPLTHWPTPICTPFPHHATQL